VSAPAIGTRPYIGLRYFEERDAHLFYGRDEHVSELLAKLAQNRFVAVMGSSGCGKSSLVRAGLLPELRSGMIPKAGPRWKVVEFRPGRAPLQELSHAVHSEFGVEPALVEEGPLGIARAIGEAKFAEGTNVLVIADQYEEVFRFQREEWNYGRWIEAAEQCQALTRRLLDAATQLELPIYVLLVMRSDYLGECAQFPDLPERMSESLYLVPRLRRDQLQEAITAPVGRAVEAAVVQRLLGEVGSDPDQLPRLQHLLGRMWDGTRGGTLTMDSYTDTGGWEKGLEQHLEVVYTNLSAPQQTVCARVFQQLSELDKGRGVRRRADMAELIEVCGPEAVEVVAKFRDEGFIRSQENPVDITHECILREWPRLKGWLEQEDRNARRLRQLAEAAKDANWQPGLTTKQGEPVQGLAGLTLQSLVSWRDDTRPSAAWARSYMTTVDYETASNYLTWSEMREKAQEEHALWRTRALFALFALLLVGLAVASLVFYQLKKAADATSRESKARELAAFSTESLSAGLL
jgi:energy-coupling factor transporter ATP-binding protein EcfA2